MEIIVGARVIYTPKTRPNLVCVSCERSSEDMDEAAILTGLTGAIGKVDRILDPRDLTRVVKCKFCSTEYPVTPHIRSLGIRIVLEEAADTGYIGIWAYPDELEVIPLEEKEQGQ